MKAFATLQIGNCPFVWIFHDKAFSNKQALKITCGDKAYLLQDLLRKDEKNSVFAHHITVFLSYTFRFQIFRSFLYLSALLYLSNM